AAGVDVGAVVVPPIVGGWRVELVRGLAEAGGDALADHEMYPSRRASLIASMSWSRRACALLMAMRCSPLVACSRHWPSHWSILVVASWTRPAGSGASLSALCV